MNSEEYKVGPSIMEIPKINIKELIKSIVIQSPVLAFVDFEFLMKTNPNATYFDIMKTILNVALDEHTKHMPLFKRSRIFVSGDSYTFVDNLESYIEGNIPEEFLTLVPKVSPHNIQGSMLHSRRGWHYNSPVLTGVRGAGSIFCDYMTYYPTVMEEDKSCDNFTEDSYIYYMKLFGGKSSDFIFRKQFYFQILKYLKGIKNNLRYPDMPMEFMQGLDEDYHQLLGELPDLYRKNQTLGDLYI